MDNNSDKQQEHARFEYGVILNGSQTRILAQRFLKGYSAIKKIIVRAFHFSSSIIGDGRETCHLLS